MKIPFAPPYIDDDVKAEVLSTLESGWITTGPRVLELEKLIAEKIGLGQVACCNSATSALMLCLHWFGVTRGDEGLLAMTFPHVVGVRRGKFYRHFDETSAGDAHIFFSYILAAHGRNGTRLGAFRKLAGALTRRIRNERAPL